MSEQRMRQRVNKALRSLDAFSVENPAFPGTPDVNYVEGWIELKQKAEWPTHARSIVSLPHFTPQQRVILRRRWEAGGNAYLLLQVRQEWLLFSGTVAATLVGRATEAELRQAALYVWQGQQMEKEIRHCLSR